MLVVLVQEPVWNDRQEPAQDLDAQILSQYCLCEEREEQGEQIEQIEEIKSIEQEEPIEQIESFLPSKSDKSLEPASVRRTQKRLILENFDFNRQAENLTGILEDLPNSNDEIISPKRKNIRRRDESSKRSNYIGVTKNGPNWQSLISINRRKTYIGTYITQDEAARAFDIYSLLLHGLKASTNFPYTKAEILSALEEFLASS